MATTHIHEFHLRLKVLSTVENKDEVLSAVVENFCGPPHVEPPDFSIIEVQPTILTSEAELKKKWHRYNPALFDHETVDELIDEAVQAGYSIREGLEHARVEVLAEQVQILMKENEGLKARLASTTENAEGFEFTQEEKDCLKAGDKINAIHSLRRRLGLDLVTAKKLCDRGRFW